MKRFASSQIFYIGGFIMVLVVAFGLLYLFSSRSIETRQETILELESRVLVDDVEHFFRDKSVTLDNVADYIASEGEAGLLGYLVALDEQYDDVASIYLGKPDNTMVNSTGFSPSGGFDLRERAWYRDAIEEDDTVYSPAFLNATEDRLIVTIARPVYDGETLVGVLGVDIDISTISKLIGGKVIDEHGYAFLVDQEGHVIGHPEHDEEDLTLRPITDYHPDYAMPEDLGLHENDTIGERDGVLYHASLFSDSYRLTLYMPASDHANHAQILGINFVALFFVVTAFSGIAGYGYFKHYVEPSRMLFKEIEGLDHVRKPSEALSEDPSFGLTGIRRSLNQLLRSQREYFEKYQASEQALKLENQRVRRLMESNADIVFEVDKTHRYRSVYGEGVRTLGFNPEDLIGKTAVDVHGDEGRAHDRAYEKAFNGQKSKYEWTHETKDGLRHYETIVSPIYEANDTIHRAVGIARDITEQKEKQRRIEYLSERDHLTGLYNRRHFSTFLDEHDTPSNRPLGIMMIDLNGLKIFNDAYGHDAGDRALNAVADTLKSIEDATHHVSRIGGDEFAVIVLDTDEEALLKLKEHLIHSIATVEVKDINLSVAVGFALKKSANDQTDEVFRSAEDSMYRNKLIEGRSARNNTIQAIQETLNQKFETEKRHSRRVADLSRDLGEALGLLDYQLDELELAGLYHDIGKISLPDTLLQKPGALSEKEFETVRKHTEYGYQILRAADEYSDLAKHALYHHERIDGTGYPEGLNGTDIPLFARIIAVADAFEAMTSDRPYRSAMREAEAFRELEAHSGTQFDPEIVKTFMRIHGKE